MNYCSAFRAGISKIVATFFILASLPSGIVLAQNIGQIIFLPAIQMTLSDQTQIIPAKPGDTITYTLVIENQGTERANNITLDRTGDDNTELIPGTFQSTPVAIPAQILTVLEDVATTIELRGVDPDGDFLTFIIVENAEHADLTNLTSQSEVIATIDYLAEADFNGADQFLFAVSDDDGNQDTSLVEIMVQPVNDAPSFMAGDEVIVSEDAGLQNLVWATSIEAGAANEAAQLLQFNILNNDNPDLFAVAPVIAADGTLSFEAMANVSGSAVLEVQLQDDGGTANGGTDISAIQPLTITVQPVNDAPSFTTGADISVETTTDAQTFMNWATEISPGADDEISQVLTFIIENIDNPELFAVAPVLASDGTLTFTAAEDAVGTATITIKLQDDGGKANGGVDTSDTQSFTIILTSSGG